jgi:predicted DNA-binding ribbon-helix-helix protein
MKFAEKLAMDQQPRRVRSRKPSLVIKHSVKISGRHTSVSLEEAFWDLLSEIASIQNISISDLVANIDQERPLGGNLSSAIRVFILEHYRKLAEAKR